MHAVAVQGAAHTNFGDILGVDLPPLPPALAPGEEEEEVVHLPAEDPLWQLLHGRPEEVRQAMLALPLAICGAGQPVH